MKLSISVVAGALLATVAGQLGTSWQLAGDQERANQERANGGRLVSHQAGSQQQHHQQQPQQQRRQLVRRQQRQQLQQQWMQSQQRQAQQQHRAAPAPVVGSNHRRPGRPPRLMDKRQATPQSLLGPVTQPKGKAIDRIPILGLGTFGFFTRKATTDAIVGAFQKGYRHIDAAMIYQNEQHVGAGINEGLKRTGLKREEIWVTTKLWNNRHGSLAKQGLQEALKRMNLTYIDVFLMHFPVGQTSGPAKFDHVETWKEMEKLVSPSGAVRRIGVSNFSPKQMKDILAIAKIKPYLHQFETHPYLQQADFVKWHHEQGIVVTGYAPLANTSPYYAQARISNPSHAPVLINNTVVTGVGRARGCSGAQVALAWNMRRGVAVIPKAGQPRHQTEDVQAFAKCKLTDDDVKKLDGMAAKWTGRFNNPCKAMKMPCFEGLENAGLGTNPESAENNYPGSSNGSSKGTSKGTSKASSKNN